MRCSRHVAYKGVIQGFGAGVNFNSAATPPRPPRDSLTESALGQGMTKLTFSPGWSIATFQVIEQRGFLLLAY